LDFIRQMDGSRELSGQFSFAVFAAFFVTVLGYSWFRKVSMKELQVPAAFMFFVGYPILLYGVDFIQKNFCNY